MLQKFSLLCVCDSQFVLFGWLCTTLPIYRHHPSFEAISDRQARHTPYGPNSSGQAVSNSKESPFLSTPTTTLTEGEAKSAWHGLAWESRYDGLLVDRWWLDARRFECYLNSAYQFIFWFSRSTLWCLPVHCTPSVRPPARSSRLLDLPAAVVESSTKLVPFGSVLFPTYSIHPLSSFCVYSTTKAPFLLRT